MPAMMTLLIRPRPIGADVHMSAKLCSVSWLSPVPPRATAVLGLSARSIRYSTGTAMKTSSAATPARDTSGGSSRSE